MHVESTTHLTSVITREGALRISLEDAELGPPGPDDVVIEVRAAPVNPSDVRLLLGPVDPSSLTVSGTEMRPIVEGRIPESALGTVAARLDMRMAVGNEGAGVVVHAGSHVRHLIGRTLAFLTTQGSYATHRVVNINDCIVVDEGVSAEVAAGAFINPLTALCMIQTLRRDGHTALVHTAAASNVGRMLSRLCVAEHVPLVNVVRSADQARVLHAEGARYVVDSSSPGFYDALTDAIRATGATLAFDAIGGGRTASTILSAMERVGRENMHGYSAYGSPVLKQVWNYGLLDPGPRIIDLDVGTAWSVGGWLMAWELAKLDRTTVEGLKARVGREIGTTFVSRYNAAFTLTELLSTQALQECMQRGTNRKCLVVPNGRLGSHQPARLDVRCGSRVDIMLPLPR